MTVVVHEIASSEGDGDDYDTLGVGEAELYANNPSTGVASPAEGEMYGETFEAVDVSSRSRRALGGAAFEGYQTDRIMPRRIPFNRRVFGSIVLGPNHLN
jgi:hypothetical protein